MKYLVYINHNNYIYEVLVIENTIARVTRINNETNIPRDIPFDCLTDEVQELIIERVEEENEAD